MGRTHSSRSILLLVIAGASSTGCTWQEYQRSIASGVHPPVAARPLAPANSAAPSSTTEMPVFEERDDETIERIIETELDTSRQLSPTAKRVRVRSIHRRVTVSGPVNMLSERDVIVAIAKSANGGHPVDDQIVVRR